MEYRYLIKDSEQLCAYQQIAKAILPKMEQFIDYLQSHYGLSDLPKAVILSDYETATKLICNIPVPAYTNEHRTIFCPELEVWRDIYLRQLDSYDDPAIQYYYKECLSPDHILQILGHEFVHHCDAFISDFDSYCDSELWFEEGMCEYISRKFFLSDEAFQAEADINAQLVHEFESTHGEQSLGAFSSETYQKSFAGIFCAYWKAFLAVQELIDSQNGDIKAVLAEYHNWNRTQSLAKFFQLEP